MKIIHFALVCLFTCFALEARNPPDGEEQPVLMPLAESGLSIVMYNAIVNIHHLTVVQRNTLMGAVREALDLLPRNQAVRDAAIDAAVVLNAGADPEVAAIIRAAADMDQPIMN